MVYRGHVQNGQVVFDEPVKLPEGTPVEVNPLAEPQRNSSDKEIPTLYERLKPIIGAAKGLPPDASLNVDHYLYGHPKK